MIMFYDDGTLCPRCQVSTSASRPARAICWPASAPSRAAVGAASQRQLGRAIGVDPRNLVLLIDQLEERGLVERAADLGDRRRHAVRLTPAGEAALGELRRVGAEAEDELLAPLDERERK